MRRALYISAVALSAITLLALSSGCKKAEKKTAAERKINVRTNAALKMKLRPSVSAVGALKCYDRARVSAEIEGILSSVPVFEGHAVGKGSLLARIDEKDIRLEVERAEAAAAQAEAALSNIKVEYERKKSLFEDRLVTAQQFDDVSARLSIAESELRKSRSTLSTVRQKLDKTALRSPIDGVIEEKKVSPGDYVRPGMELFSVIRVNPIKIEFTVAEKEISFLRVGQDVSFRVAAFPEREFKGKVKIIHPSLDEAARTLKVEAEAANPGGLLKPGLFAQVTLYIGAERDAVLVPSTALLYEGEEMRAFVLNGDSVEQRHPKIGGSVKLPGGEFTEVIDGIKEGEQVVVVGQQNLFGGAKVNVAR